MVNNASGTCADMAALSGNTFIHATRHDLFSGRSNTRLSFPVLVR